MSPKHPTQPDDLSLQVDLAIAASLAEAAGNPEEASLLLALLDDTDELGEESQDLLPAPRTTAEVIPIAAFRRPCSFRENLTQALGGPSGSVGEWSTLQRYLPGAGRSERLSVDDTRALLIAAGVDLLVVEALLVNSGIRRWQLETEAKRYVASLVHLLSELLRAGQVVVEEDLDREVQPINRLLHLVALYVTFFLAWPAADDLLTHRISREEVPLSEADRARLDRAVDALGDLLLRELRATFEAESGVGAAVATARGRLSADAVQTSTEIRNAALVQVVRGLDAVAGARRRMERGVGLFDRISKGPTDVGDILEEAAGIVRNLVADAGARLGREAVAQSQLRDLRAIRPESRGGVGDIRHSVVWLSELALDPRGLLLDHMRGITYNVLASPRVQTEGFIDWRVVDDVFFYEPPSLSNVAASTEFWEAVVAQCPSSVVIAADLHLVPGTDDRFTIQSRGARLARNAERVQAAYPHVRMHFVGESFGSLVVAYAHLQMEDEPRAVTLISPPFEPAFPDALRVLLRVAGVNRRLGPLLSTSMWRKLQTTSFVRLVDAFGVVVDACYPDEHRKRMRSYWSAAIRNGWLRPADLAREADEISLAARAPRSSEFYAAIHTAVAEDPRLSVVIDPEDRLLPSQSRWLRYPAAQALRGVGHSPTHLSPVCTPLVDKLVASALAATAARARSPG